ncbi:MAG: hypothetical protein V3T07_06495, partial [Myxococcota bacterium]
KGTVQTVRALPPGRGEGAVKVTTQLFFRPGGKSTQNGGVRADVVIPSLTSTDDFGEKNHPYSLLNQETTPFLGNAANGRLDASKRWRPITDETISGLTALSQDRIRASDQFKRIREKLAKAGENGGVLHLADLIKEKEEAKAAKADSETSDPADPADPPSTPQLEEAIHVLADLIALNG